MKYFNLLIFLTFISVCQAQIDKRPFYYYFDERVQIDIDSSNAILVIGDLKSKEDLLALLTLFGYSNRIYQNNNSVYVVGRGGLPHKDVFI